MNGRDLMEHAAEIKRHKDVGVQHLVGLRKYIEKHFSEHVLFETTQGGTSEQFSFYGSRFLFRIELHWQELNLNSAIIVYELRQSRSLPLTIELIETPLKYTFDGIGNVKDEAGRSVHLFGEKSFTDLLSSLNKNGALLTP